MSNLSDQFGPYSPLKVFHHQERLSAIKSGGHPAPAQVQIILSDLCNEDCSFCSYRVSGNLSNELFNDPETGSHNPNRMIVYPKVKEILDDCKAMGVGAIQLTGGGEPTVHPRFDDILLDVKARGLGLSLVTNGIKMSDAAVGILMGADWVRVSIDAALDHTYAKMRRVPEKFFARAQRTIRDLAAKKRATGSTVEIGVGFVVTKENWREIEGAVVNARMMGADNIRISAAFLPEDEKYHEQHFMEAAVFAADAVRKFDSPTFRVFNRFGARVEDLKQHAPEYHFCGYQRFTTYIGADLNLYRCCNLAYNTRGIVASLKEQTFRQAWETVAQKDFDSFDATGCTRCQFNGINRTINYALADAPPHVDYV